MSEDLKNSYGYNTKFLKQHTEIIELESGNAKIALAPAWQGRVMTSSAEGDNGLSFGWINHSLIESGEKVKHINAYGGEERFWLGPEGGQFSLFFQRGTEFIFENWQTPSFIDSEPYLVTRENDTSVVFSHDAEFYNYSGTRFRIGVEREVTILGPGIVKRLTGTDPGDSGFVAYRSDNRIINRGQEKWDKSGGLISVWMLGMLNPSPGVIVVAPVAEGNISETGPVVNADYFGQIPADRLRVTEKHIFFAADGKSRGKIGIPPRRSLGVIGSYDSDNNSLTLLICQKPGKDDQFVNSAWELQDDPFSGDAINSYNDGPLEDGTQMGPFYELESSSPALSLGPGESFTYTQYTIHFISSPEVIEAVSTRILGIGTEEIKGALKLK